MFLDSCQPVFVVVFVVELPGSLGWSDVFRKNRQRFEFLQEFYSIQGFVQWLGFLWTGVFATQNIGRSHGFGRSYLVAFGVEVGPGKHPRSLEGYPHVKALGFCVRQDGCHVQGRPHARQIVLVVVVLVVVVTNVFVVVGDRRSACRPTTKQWRSSLERGGSDDLPSRAEKGSTGVGT